MRWGGLLYHIIVIMETIVVVLALIMFVGVCCMGAMECECCADCGRDDAFDAHNAAKDEAVSNPMEV